MKLMHRGVQGTARLDDDGKLRGKLFGNLSLKGVGAVTLTYEGNTASELEACFQQRVDALLARFQEELDRKRHKSVLLEDHARDRVDFDPANHDHLQAYAHFLYTGKWTMAFNVELPYDNVDRTIRAKIIEHALKPYAPTAALAA